jgi:hypothetical protein
MTSSASSWGVAAAAAAPPPPVSRERALEDLHSAMEMLPLEKKASYLKAKRLCPNLVSVETDPFVFYQHDNFNYWKAAERLASHWYEREQLFGDRAFLPMTQTGHGALTKEDVVTLHTGSHAILPPNVAGKQVCFTDRRRILSTSHRESRKRCLFYIYATISRGATAASQGAFFLVLLVTPRPSDLDWGYMQYGVRLMRNMPIAWDLHILNCVSKTGKWAVADQLIKSVVSYIIEHFGGHSVTTENSQGELLQKLTKLGLGPNNLPSSVGGSWKYEGYTRWCRNKIMEELYFEDVHLPRKKGSTAGLASNESKKERTKALNVLHSRQKRERRKAEQATMQQDCDRLQMEKWALQSECSRLESLLSQSLGMVEQYEAANYKTRIQPLQPTFGRNCQQAMQPDLHGPAPAPQNSYQSLALHQQGEAIQALLLNTMNAPSMQNQSVNAMVNQSLHQPMNHPLSHTMAQSINHPAYQCPLTQMAASMIQGMDQPMNRRQPVDHLVNASGPRSLNPGSVGHLINAAAQPTMKTQSMPQSQFDFDPIPLRNTSGQDVDLDPFAPVPVHPNNARVPSFSSSNPTAAAAEPYANFALEPDPLPETATGIPTYQWQHQQELQQQQQQQNGQQQQQNGQQQRSLQDQCFPT